MVARAVAGTAAGHVRKIDVQEGGTGAGEVANQDRVGASLSGERDPLDLVQVHRHGADIAAPLLRLRREPEAELEEEAGPEVLFDEDEELEEGEETNEEVALTPEVDPYLERRNGGRRVIELPDIAKYLTAEAAE